MDAPLEYEDLIEHLIADWKRERPELDASAMEIVGRIMQLGKVLEKRASRALQSTNIYYTDLDVLATLRRTGEPYKLSPSQLCQSVVITSGAMTAVLDRLEKIGLLFRTPDPKDGRVKMAVLTKNGKNVIDKAIAIRFDEASSAIEAFEMIEKKQLSQLLKKMVVTLEKEQLVETS